MRATSGWLSGTLILGLVLVGSPAVFAKGLTQEQGEAILSELKEIHALLEQQMKRGASACAPQGAAVPAKAKVSVEGGYSLGQADAPLTLVEFADYQCPFCTRFHADVFKALKKDYIDTGKVRFISRDLPLPMHTQAQKAAQAARCAGEQQPDAFWGMRDLLLVNSGTLNEDNMLTYAQTLSLDAERFRSCLQSETYQTAIQRDVAEARAAGFTGTPSFVLGTASGNLVDGVTIVGAQPYSAFEARIRELLPKD